MTTPQKTLIAATLVAAVYQACNASALRRQVESLQQQALPVEQNQQLTSKLDDATRQLAALRAENERLNRNAGELLKLRGEVNRLRHTERELAQLKADDRNATNNPTLTAIRSWQARVDDLKQRLEERPDQKIPELQFLDEIDWSDQSRLTYTNEDQYLNAFSRLRQSGEVNFIEFLLRPALKDYMEANNGKFPTALGQLNSYFKSPVEEAVLQRWEIVPSKNFPDMKNIVVGDWVITQKPPPVNPKWDRRQVVHPGGRDRPINSWATNQ